MKLIEAFMERNDLKAELKELKIKIVNKAYTEKELEEKVDLIPMIEKYMELQVKLSEMNTAIYKANIKAVPVLKKIESTTEVLSLVKDLKTTLENTPVKTRNHNKRLETDPTFIEREHSVPMSYLDELATGLMKIKRFEEKSLSGLNASIEVEL